MRINTKVVYDMETLEVLERESYEYPDDAPLAKCEKAVLGAVVITAAVGATLASAGTLGPVAEGLAGMAIGALGTTAAGFAAMATSLAVTGVSMEAGAIASALTSNRGMNITTRQAAACRQIIYGQQRVGGVQIYRSTTGSHKDQFNYVIVLAGHECDSIVNLYLDGRQVHWEVGSTGNTTRNGINFGGSSNGDAYTGPNGVLYNFSGAVYCEARYGDQLPGDVIGGLTANDPNWAADGQGNSPWVAGCTYVYLKIEYNTNVFPGEPEVRFTVNGKNNIYDPRTGTTGFTTNWALVAADVITDPVFGLGDNSVNQAQLIAAANVSDEQVTVQAPGVGTEARYSTNYHYDTSVSPGDSLNTMMVGAAGRFSRIGGEYYLWPAYWQGPSFQFDVNSLTDDLKWTPYKSLSGLANRITGTYIAPTFPFNVAGNLYDQNGFYNGEIQNNFPFAFQPTNFPQYAADPAHGYPTDQFLAEDMGIVLPQEITFATVLSVTQAQRIAKIALRRNRQQGTGTFEMGLSSFSMQPADVMQFTFAQNGWVEKTLEVIGVGFRVDNNSGAPTVRCTISVAETDQSVYEDLQPGEEETVYAVPSIPFQTTYDPAPPTNMSLTSGASTALINADGSVQPRIEVQWDTPEDILTKQIQIMYQAVGAATWLSAPSVDVSLNLGFISGVIAGQPYNVRIRSARANGAISAWEEIDGYTVSITLSTLGVLALDPGSLIGEAYTGGADIIVSPFTAVVGQLRVSVLPAGPYTIPSLSQATLYWVYYIDPTFVGGAITPIATTNSADFLNKVGYFLIDSIVTPSTSGGGGGGGGGTRYAPSSYADTGSRTTSNPAAAYDGDVSTDAQVSGNYTLASDRGTTGNCIWQGFPAITTTAAASLNVTAEITSSGIACQISASVAGTASTLVHTITSAAETTYTLAIPSGTDLSTVTVTANVNGGSFGGSINSNAFIEGFEIWIA